MKNHEKKIEPLKLIDRIIPKADKNYFSRKVLNDEFPPSFTKDNSLIADRLSRQTVSISDNIKISFSLELSDDKSLYVDRESDNKYVIIKIPKV